VVSLPPWDDDHLLLSVLVWWKPSTWWKWIWQQQLRATTSSSSDKNLVGTGRGGQMIINHPPNLKLPNTNVENNKRKQALSLESHNEIPIWRPSSLHHQPGHYFNQYSDSASIDTNIIRHVLYTTISQENPSPLQLFAINFNNSTCHRIGREKKNRHCIVLVHSQTQTNPHGFPYFRTLYQLTLEQIPNADTYTYFNSDVIFSPQHFYPLLDELALSSRYNKFKGRKFWVSGQRYNYQCSSSVILKNQDVNHKQEWFNTLLQNSTLFTTNAMNYWI
jgi:hypothetical protein